jgi:hypothetical protein
VERGLIRGTPIGDPFVDEVPASESESFSDREDLLRFSNEVTTTYSWIDLPMEGIELDTYELDPAEFFRGLHAATDLVFEGTENFVEPITLEGRFANVTEILDTLYLSDPFLEYVYDRGAKRVVFTREDLTEGLSPYELSARYQRSDRLLKPDEGSGGLFYAGMLAVDGLLYPQQVRVDLMPIPSARKFVLNVNGTVVKDFGYSDPYDFDRKALAADTPEELQEVLLTRVDQAWAGIAWYPFDSTKEALIELAYQASRIPGIARAWPESATLTLEPENLEPIVWSIPTGETKKTYTETEAYSLALDFESRLLRSLGAGELVVLSQRYGETTIPRAAELLAQMMQFNRAPDRSLADMEKALRLGWKPYADWVLEIFYTSFTPPLAETNAAPPLDSQPNAPRGSGGLDFGGFRTGSTP